MAGPAARIPERRPRDGNELPAIAAVVERQLQHAEAGVVADLAVGDRRPERIPLFAAAGPRDELAHAPHRIRDTGRRLRCEALVVVLVSADHHLHAAVIQHLPGGLHPGGAAMRGARAEARVVDVGDRAGRPRGLEIALQPRELSGSGGDVHPAVQGDDVPRAEVVAVIALPGLARGAPEVGEIGSGAGGVGGGAGGGGGDGGGGGGGGGASWQLPEPLSVKLPPATGTNSQV